MPATCGLLLVGHLQVSQAYTTSFGELLTLLEEGCRVLQERVKYKDKPRMSNGSMSTFFNCWVVKILFQGFEGYNL